MIVTDRRPAVQATPTEVAQEMEAEGRAVVQRIRETAHPPRQKTSNPVRQARRAADLTQAQLCAKAGVSSWTLIRMEHSKADWEPSGRAMFAVARALGKTVDELFSGMFEGAGR